MKVTLRETALADLDSIYDWIAKDNPQNAISVTERLLDAMENKLAHFPFMGRQDQMQGTREWVVRGLPYIIVYRVEDEVLSIISVFHGARNR